LINLAYKHYFWNGSITSLIAFLLSDLSFCLWTPRPLMVHSNLYHPNWDRPNLDIRQQGRKIKSWERRVTCRACGGSCVGDMKRKNGAQWTECQCCQVWYHVNCKNVLDEQYFHVWCVSGQWLVLSDKQISKELKYKLYYFLSQNYLYSIAELPAYHEVNSISFNF
jgi:hypothetical protein